MGPVAIGRFVGEGFDSDCMKIEEGKGANRLDLHAFDLCQLHHRCTGSRTAICLERIDEKYRPFSVKSASPHLRRLVSPEISKPA